MLDPRPPGELPREADETFAMLVDYLREYRDCADAYNETQKFEIYDELQSHIDALKVLGVSLRYATRKIQVKWGTGADVKPMLATVLLSNSHARTPFAGIAALYRRYPSTEELLRALCAEGLLERAGTARGARRRERMRLGRRVHDVAGVRRVHDGVMGAAGQRAHVVDGAGAVLAQKRARRAVVAVHVALARGSAYTDGALWANNPGIVAYGEAMRIREHCRRRQIDPPFDESDIRVLSIGTGKKREPGT